MDRAEVEKQIAAMEKSSKASIPVSTFSALEKKLFKNVRFKTGNMTAKEYSEYKRELALYKTAKAIKLDKHEYAHVISELNTHMSADDRKEALVTKAIGDYYYVIVNYGFDNYKIIGRYEI